MGVAASSFKCLSFTGQNTRADGTTTLPETKGGWNGYVLTMTEARNTSRLYIVTLLI